MTKWPVEVIVGGTKYETYDGSYLFHPGEENTYGITLENLVSMITHVPTGAFGDPIDEEKKL